MYVCMYVYMYVYVYIHTYMYIHIAAVCRVESCYVQGVGLGRRGRRDLREGREEGAHWGGHMDLY